MTAAVVAQCSWEAIGTTALLCTTDPTVLMNARSILADELDRVDRAASNYRPDSELARVVAGAGRVHAVSQDLLEVVGAAVDAARRTDGLVDPTLGHGARWQEIEMTDWSLRVPVGAKLDFGATGKALIADRAAARIAEAEGPDLGVLVSLGGDIAVAGPWPGEGWSIRVTDDHRADVTSPGQTIAVRNGGLATSGTTVRTGPHGHHIIDPRTGRSAKTPWRTVSVVASSCVEANAASTAAIVLGTLAVKWLTLHQLPARLVQSNGDVATTCGWPGEKAAVQ